MATSNAAAAVPYAHSIIAVGHEVFETIRRTVAALHRIAHLAAYQARVDVGADAVSRHRPPNHAVFMGYDFHLTAEGPRLIEVNTNAGGALLNGLHTASLCPPEPLACLCADLIPFDTMRDRLLGTFRAEFAAARPGAPLTRVAIADDRPEQQFLRAEFALFRELFRSAGIDTAWWTRRDWVFKPGALHASRAVYRGDEISRHKFDAIAAIGGFVAQRRIEPGALEVTTLEGPRRMKFDVRAYAYRDEILLLGARVYEGQVTNFRTPGGGFSAICVVRDEAPPTGSN